MTGACGIQITRGRKSIRRRVVNLGRAARITATISTRPFPKTVAECPLRGVARSATGAAVNGSKPFTAFWLSLPPASVSGPVGVLNPAISMTIRGME